MARAFAPGDRVEYRRASAQLQAWLRRGTRGTVVERPERDLVIVDFGTPFTRVWCAPEDLRRIASVGDVGRTIRRRTRRNPNPYASEKQGPGRRYWFHRAADAVAFADYKRRAGWVVVTDPDSWDDPDAGPSVWCGPRNDPRTADVVAGIDPAAL